MKSHNRARIPIGLAAILGAVIVLAFPGSAQSKEEVLYSFQGLPNDGAYPAGGVVFDKAGNLYGATSSGGADNCPGIGQCGIVYQLKPPTEKGKPWAENVLYVFRGVNANDGNTPEGGVLLDQAGNVYGTTAYGGTGKCRLFGGRVGCGTVFELIPPTQKSDKWTEKVVYSFQSGKDGYFPWGDLTVDSAGNLYGATQYGGGYGSCNAPYYQFCGTVFKLSPPTVKGDKWTEKVLYAFKSGTDGANPNGGLVFDSRGAIYGTTLTGGNQGCKYNNYGIGCGIVFILGPISEQGPSWIEKVLHRFADRGDGANPSGGVILDATSALYGTTGAGGTQKDGVVFRLARKNGTWTETVVHNFTNNVQGRGPSGPLTFDSSGKLYGLALGGLHLRGVVYRLAPQMRTGSWTYSVPYEFKGPPDGAYPAGALVFDVTETLYGTTQGGGTGLGCQGGCGAAFEISP